MLNAESLRPERNSNGRGSLENDNNDNLSERLDKHSRNTRLNHDENFDDAFAGISVITPYSSLLSVGAGKGDFFI